jgi:hypothetical protein
LKSLFLLGDLSESEYRSERDRLKAKLAELSPREMRDLERAVRLVQDFGVIWDGTTPDERKRVVHTLFEAVYLDSGEHGPLVAVEPRAEFGMLFDMLKIPGVGRNQELDSA